MACRKYFRVYLVGGFLFGYHIAVISGVLTMIDFRNMTHKYKLHEHSTNDNDILDATTGPIVGTLLIGCFFGSLIGGRMSDRISRKYSISIFSIIFMISAAIQTVSVKPVGLPMILIGCFFAGKYSIVSHTISHDREDEDSFRILR